MPCTAVLVKFNLTGYFNGQVAAMKVSTTICTSKLHLLVTVVEKEALGAWHSHTQSEINSAEVAFAADDSWTVGPPQLSYVQCTAGGDE